MSLTTRAWLVIALAGAGTFAIRASFLLLAERFDEVPESVRDALRMIPPAALAALVAPALLRPDAALDPLGPRALAGVIALAVAWWTRSVLLTVAVGLVAVVGLQVLLA